MKALNKILNGYNRTITKLEKLSEKNERRMEAHCKKIEKMEAKILELKEKNLQLILESEEAKEVAEKIRAMTSTQED